jgi:N-acetylglucosamine kinase-like BadF-type ATPase
MNYKIGVDGGGTKTECILVNLAGQIVASHLTTGCNPSVVGPAAAAATVSTALDALLASVADHAGGSKSTGPKHHSVVTHTLLCMAGSRGFWSEFAAGLAGFGQVQAVDDSLPILELATHGGRGLALHAGTGSFVAARGPENAVHYAGGRGWRFGDAGSGYDLGARAIGRALFEIQGWAPDSTLTPAVLVHAGLDPKADASAVTRHFYQHADATRHIAALAPAVLRLADKRDKAARQIVTESTGALLDLAIAVANKLFPGADLTTVPAGLSGPILTHSLVREILAARSPMPLTAIADAPTEGVRQLLMRL